jgi:hypothetical protein
MDLTPPFIESATSMTFQDLIDTFLQIINEVLIPILLTVTLAVIIWKVIEMLLLHPGDEQARTSGKRVIVLGVIVMTVILSVWGIVALIRTSIFG